jgi:CRISPR-associated endonuclease/helicase Cas3
VERDATPKILSKAFGKSGLVYAPYVLLRTAEVFGTRESIVLPDQIRDVIEATYAKREAGEEPEGWQELLQQWQRVIEYDAALAKSATNVLGQQSQDDAKELLTRRKGAPTRDVVLVRACEMATKDQWRITLLNGELLTVSGFDWSLAAAQAVHRNLVRAPLHTVPPQTTPSWLKLHTHGPTFCAVVQKDGALHFPDAEGASALTYDSMLGLYTRPSQPPPHYTEDDNEFDF